MTREEAINKLKWALDNNTIEDVESAHEYIVAIEMAIKALRMESCDGCKHKNMWEDECECGYNSPCTGCRRRAIDNYKSGKWNRRRVNES